VDHQTIEMFERDLEGNLERLQQELKEGSYRPQAIRRVEVPKPGSKERRPPGIPTVRDRVVQTGLLMVLEPIFERGFPWPRKKSLSKLKDAIPAKTNPPMGIASRKSFPTSTGP